MRTLYQVVALLLMAWAGVELLLWSKAEQLASFLSQLHGSVEAYEATLKKVAAWVGSALILIFLIFTPWRRVWHAVKDFAADIVINPGKAIQSIVENAESLDMGRGAEKVKEGWLIKEEWPFYYLYEPSTIREYYFLKERAQELQEIALKIRDEKFPTVSRDEFTVRATIAFLHVDVVLPDTLTEAEIKILHEMRRKSFRRGWNIFPSKTNNGCTRLTFSKPSEVAVRLRDNEGISLHEAGRRMGDDFFREKDESGFKTITKARNEENSPKRKKPKP